MAKMAFGLSLFAALVSPRDGIGKPAETTPDLSASRSSSVPAIEFERFTLSNGLEVLLHRDPSVPLVAVDVWYHVGSGDEAPGKSGFAHLFEHMMFQGAKHIGKDVHFQILRKLGASTVNGTTNSDRTNYFEVVPSHHLETALWLESDRMGYLLDLLDPKSLQNQIDVVRNERRQRYDNVAYGKDRFAVAAALYPEGHPYRYLTIGRHEDLENAKLEDVRQFFMKWYVPSNATLVLAGDFEVETARALVEKWFGSFPKLPEPEHERVQAPVLEKEEEVQIDDPLARYRRLHWTWLSPARLAPGDAELQILATVLGASGWGRLHRLLVIEKELAQRVSVYQSGKGHSGEFHIVVDVRPGRDWSAVEPLVEAELKKVLDARIDESELRRVKTNLESSFVWNLETVLSRAEQLQFFNHYAGDPGYIDEYLETYRSRTAEDVQRVASEVLAKPRVSIMTTPAPESGPSRKPRSKAKEEAR